MSESLSENLFHGFRPCLTQGWTKTSMIVKYLLDQMASTHIQFSLSLCSVDADQAVQLCYTFIGHIGESRFLHVKDYVIISICLELFFSDLGLIPSPLERHRSLCVRKPTIWVLTRSNTNRALQSQKMVRGWKFWI